MKNLFSCLLMIIALQIKAQVINRTFYFDSGKSKISKGDQLWLDSLSAILRSTPDYSIAIRAYCDADGSDESNKVLAAARAQTVSQIFILNGLENKNITSIPVGESDPLGDNETESGKAKNRRVQIALVYKPVN